MQGDEVKEVEGVEIEETVVEDSTPVIDLEGLDSVEKEMAGKQGVVPTEKVEKKEEVKEEGKADEEPARFEDVEKNERMLKDMSKKDQAFYWQWKADKVKRQTAQREHELAVIREKALNNELERIRNSNNISDSKLNKINNLLTGDPENITIEAIQDILKEQATTTADNNKKRPVTVEDLEAIEEKKRKKAEEESAGQAFINRRIEEAEAHGRSKYDNYDEILNQAKEVFDGKVELPDVVDRDYLFDKLRKAIENKDVDLDTVAGYVVSIAKFNPRFGKPESPTRSSSEKKETNENIDRILKNANKQQTSAAVGGGGNGRRLVSYADLTVEDAAKLTTEQWKRVPEDIRRKLLR